MALLTNPIGQFSARKPCAQSKVSTQTMYVIEGLIQKTNLLGLPAITALLLLVRVDATSMEMSVFERYPSVFNGLGNLGDEYKIQLKPDAKPYVRTAYVQKCATATERQSVKRT